MTSRLGRVPGRAKAAAAGSILSLQKTDDECGPEDVNIPLPVCGAFNKVCRDYNALRQYVRRRPDGSERHHYDIEVLSDEPPGRW